MSPAWGSWGSEYEGRTAGVEGEGALMWTLPGPCAGHHIGVRVTCHQPHTHTHCHTHIHTATHTCTHRDTRVCTPPHMYVHTATHMHKHCHNRVYTPSHMCVHGLTSRHTDIL